MILYCSYRFYEQVCELKKNNSYASIIIDICDYFKDKSTSELHITKDIIQSSPNIYSLNKFRIINSLTNKGKSSSYRCLCGCYTKENFLVLDTIYPKTGSEGIDNLSKEEYKKIASNIKNAIQASELYVLDIKSKEFSKLKK